MKMIVHGLCVAAWGVFLSMGGLAFAQNTEQRPPEREYVIGVNDSLEIQVRNEKDFTRRAPVRADGKITMPFIGDIQAAGLKLSVFKAELEKQLKRYLIQPQLTVEPLTSGVVRITFRGVVSQVMNPARGTMLLQLMREILPELREIQPPPDVTVIRITGADGEEFVVKALELLAGRAMEQNIRLEWGDEIFIPPSAPTPSPQDIAVEDAPPVAVAVIPPEAWDALVKDFPAAQALLEKLAQQNDAGAYEINLTALTDEEKETLGAELLARLEEFRIMESDAPPTFETDITLAGILLHPNISSKSSSPVVEALLAFPSEQPGDLPRIQRFQEGEVVSRGGATADDIALKEIRDVEKLVILGKGKAEKELTLPPTLSQAKLTGIFKQGHTRKAFFTDVAPSVGTKRPAPRVFQEGDELEKGVAIAKITAEWVLLTSSEKTNPQTQLMLLHESRESAKPTPVPNSLPTPAPELAADGKTPGMAAQLSSNLLQNALPPPLKALNTLSKLFFATPLLETPAAAP